MNYHHDPHGRMQEVYAQYTALELRAKDKLTELPTRVDTHKREIQSTTEEVQLLLRTAYESLEEVIDVLLTFEDGDARLSSANAQFLKALQASSQVFEQFCSRADNFVGQLGSFARDCMQLGDEADNFLTEIRAWQSSLSLEVSSVKEAISLTEAAREQAMSSEANYTRALIAAVENRNDTANQIFSFFSSDTERNLNNEVDNARNHLEDARRRRGELESKTHELASLLAAVEGTIAQLNAILQLVTDASVEYDNEFTLMSNARDSESTTWTGLIKLTDHVCAPTFKSTRDNSLRAVLQLLSADDTVFLGHEAAAASEERIHDAVNGKLGTGAVERLMSPVQVPLEQFSVDWPEGLP